MSIDHLLKTNNNALLSVYDKTGIAEFAKGLHELGWNIISSGGTAKVVAEAGVPVTDVAELVGGEAILGHRVVTLSREVHSGLLADADKPEDLTELKERGIPLIDLVAVDMYPLEEEIASGNATLASVIEKTDIGGPTMLRAGAKARRIVLSRASQRSEVLQWLTDGKPDEKAFRDKLCAVAEYECARYILISAKYHGGEDVAGWIGQRVAPTKYGENPWQTPAGLYADNRVAADPLGLNQFTHQKGWELSYINETDMHRLLQTVTHIAAGFDVNFSKVPCVAVGVKHGNACGAGVADTTVEAVQKMLEGDEIAIFGGVVMVNGPIDADVATALMQYHMPEAQSRLLDGVVGSEVTPEAMEILSRAKLRIVTNPALANLSKDTLETAPILRNVRGGMLVQPNYTFVADLKADYIERHGSVTQQQEQDLIQAWAVGSTSNSNTICIVKDGRMLGNGVGQQDRVGAAKLAVTRATSRDHDVTGAAAYSDSFFPFPDGPLVLADAGITAILTSSGSVKDPEVVETLAKKNVAVMMLPDKTGRGFFGH
jgi:phosphoribosylaminoimidazolecarboxamide formyltransferase/IMP cyclohydrolase